MKKLVKKVENIKMDIISKLNELLPCRTFITASIDHGNDDSRHQLAENSLEKYKIINKINGWKIM